MGKYDISEDLKYAMLSYDLKGVSKFIFLLSLSSSFLNNFNRS